MDKYPDTFNRANLEKKLKEKQEKLIKKTRELFDYKISTGIDDYKREIVLKFDSKMLQQSRLMIVKELLEIHGKLHVITMSGQSFEMKIKCNLPPNEVADLIFINF